MHAAFATQPQPLDPQRQRSEQLHVTATHPLEREQSSEDNEGAEADGQLQGHSWPQIETARPPV